VPGSKALAGTGAAQGGGHDQNVPQHCRVSQCADFHAMLEGAAPEGLPGFLDGDRNRQAPDAIVRASETQSTICCL